jgi:hypothetical protein
MTKSPVDLTMARTARTALEASGEAQANSARVLRAVVEDMRQLRHDMETRWQALEAHVNAAVGAMDGSVTGLHQDVANLILRMQTVTAWLQQQFPQFGTEAQAVLTQMIADMNAEAARLAAEQETPDAEPSKDAVPV